MPAGSAAQCRGRTASPCCRLDRVHMDQTVRELRPIDAPDCRGAAGNPLAMLLGHGSDAAIGIKDLGGRFLVGNQKLERLLGLAAGSLQGLRDVEAFPRAVVPSLLALNGRVIGESQTVMEELELVAGEGPVLLAEFPILATTGEPAYVGMIALDLAEGGTKAAEIGNALAEAKRRNDELQERLRTTRYLACTDGLTGARNRRWLEEILPGELSRFNRYGHPISVLLLDLDDFKSINDTYGHDEGDRVLAEFAARVRDNYRASDSIIRWGVEEFVVLCPDTAAWL